MFYTPGETLMRMMTDEERQRVLKPQEINGKTYYSDPSDTDVMNYLLRGILPSVFIPIDERYENNTPPLEKQYPILQNFSKRILKKLNQEYYSLVKSINQ